MNGFLSLPIRLVGIVLLAAFLLNVMAPLRSFELNLANISAGPEASVIAQTEVPSSEGLSLLPIGLSLIAIVSIWMVYQTYRQHIGLANNDLRNRRAAKKMKL